MNKCEPVKTSRCPVCLTRWSSSSCGSITKFPCADKVCSLCSLQYFEDKIRKGSMDFSCPICKLPNVQNETEYRSYISWLKKWLSDRLSDRRYAMFKDLLKEQRSSFNSNYLKCQLDTLSKEFEALRWSNDFVMFKCRQCKAAATIDPPATCLHISCQRCSSESCYGCNQPYYRQQCQQNRVCTYSRLHCHHPRYCAYYMRDFSVAELTGLLQTAGVTVPPPKTTASAAICSSIDADTEERCQRRVKYAAFECCSKHSQYMLAQLIRQHRVDPLPILSAKQCLQELRRMNTRFAGSDSLNLITCLEELKKYPPLVFD